MRMSRGRGSRVGAPDTMRVAFDSRPCVEVRGVGRYSRGLLGGLDRVVGDSIEIVETHRPRHVDVYHSPWIDGAILRSPCPMVVSIHDIDALTRPSERMRRGGIYLRLRHLALARATHAIVPSDAVAEDAVARLGLEPGRVVVIAPGKSVVLRLDLGGRSARHVAGLRARPVRAWASLRQYAPRCISTAGIVLSRIARSKAKDQRSR